MAGSPAWSAGELEDIEQRLPSREDAAPAPSPSAPGSEVAAPTAAEREFVLTAVVIDGATVFTPADLAPTYESYLTETVTIDDLIAIADAVTSLYREAGYGLSRAVVPSQSGLGGVIRLEVVEGYIDEVAIEGDQSEAVRRRLAALTAERPLRMASLDRALALVADMPGVTVVSTRLEPDLEDLARHRLVVTLETQRAEGWAYADNRGAGDAGDAQVYLSGALRGLAREGDELSLGVFTAPDDPEMLLFGEVGYALPLGDGGTTASVHGWSSRAEAGATLANPEIETESRSVLVRIAHPFIRGRSFTLRGDAGVEARSLQERRGAVQSFEDELRVLDAGVNIVRTSASRQTSIDLRLRAGVEAFGASTGGTGPLSRPDADGEFVTLNVLASRYQALGESFGLYATAAGQLSSDPLLASEEFKIGGAQFGRAYDYGTLSGDDGAAAAIELRYGRDPGWKTLDFYQLYAFYDAGWVWNQGDLAWLKHAGVASTGLGLRLTTPSAARLNFEAAKPLSHAAGAESDGGWQGFVSLSSSF